MARLAVFLVFALLSCSVNAQSRGNLDKPTTSTSIESLLSRFKGQTKFVTAERYYHRGIGLESMAAAAPEGARAAKAADGGGEQREVVDSDVFNTGPAGSSILVLLNGYRGLMVMDFSKGANAPVILGRAPATGNHPTNMYVNWKTNKAVVIENWNRENYGSGARILVYDLSKLSEPKVIQSVEVGGTVNDSRMVGDVIYVVGSQTGNYGYGSQENVSFAKSFKISDKEVKEVANRKLENRVDYKENMGIQEVRGADGKYQYYITALTKEKSQRWWGATRSKVELLDISSASGEIKPVMTVDVSGDVAKRSWVSINNGSLSVASNYRPGDKWDVPTRMVVETYKLPNEKSEIVDNDEFTFRVLSAEREVNKLNLTEKEKAIFLAKHKIRGTFIRKEGKALRKTVSDFLPLDFGDTTGKSAQIQDVRYVTDEKGNTRIHIFWVPADQIDPLDIVDITNPDERPDHQSRLQFEGWIERSIPVNFNGKRYIVALGYIVPAVDNPGNKRFAQAKIIEVKQVRGGGWKSEEVDTLTLEKVSWSDVGGQDKLVGFSYDAKTGQGSVLFKGYGYDKKGWVEGGQTVNFDLSNAADESKKVLAEGAFIQGSEGWLRRVFGHPQLNAMMTFSDRELGVFKKEDADGTKFLDAAYRLELARNIIAYHDLPDKESGIQVIRKGDYRTGSVELRLVENADAEKSEVKGFELVPGRYVDHWADESTGQIMVITQEDNSKYDNKTHTQTTEYAYRIALIKFGGTAAEQKISNEFVVKNVVNYNEVGINPPQDEHPEQLTSNLRGLVSLDKNKWAWVDGTNQIWELSVNKDGSLDRKQVKVDLPKGYGAFTLSKVDGQLMIVAKKPVTEEAEALSRNWQFYETYVFPVASDWTIKTAFNVPGEPVSVIWKDNGPFGFLTKEERVVDLAGGLTEPTVNYVWQTKAGSTDMELKDLANMGEGAELKRLHNNEWLFVETVKNDNGYSVGWGPRRRGRSSGSGYRLGVLNANTDTHTLERNIRAPQGSQMSGWSYSIVGVFDGKTGDELRVAVSASDKVELLSLDINKMTVDALELTPVNTFVTPKEVDSKAKFTMWQLPSYISTWDAKTGVASLKGDRLRIALGDSGVCEAIVGGKAKEEDAN